jgi:hypothetical protein
LGIWTACARRALGNESIRRPIRFMARGRISGRGVAGGTRSARGVLGELDHGGRQDRKAIGGRGRDTAGVQQKSPAAQRRLHGGRRTIGGRSPSQKMYASSEKFFSLRGGDRPQRGLKSPDDRNDENDSFSLLLPILGDT